MRIGRALATAFQKHFRGKGFDVTLPEHRLTVVTLAGPDSYAAFLGEDPGQVVGGHYDLDTNRLVIFDFRPDAANLAADPERINTLTLIHEATHQLTFNTGLLNRLGDVPLCLSEGLATYGEVWRPGGRPPAGGDQHAEAPGARRRPATRRGLDSRWTDCSPTTRRSAPRPTRHRPTRRAGSWSTPCSPIARAFPASAPTSTPSGAVAIPRSRLDDATTHLGNLDRLDRTLQQAARRLIRA